MSGAGMADDMVSNCGSMFVAVGEDGEEDGFELGGVIVAVGVFDAGADKLGCDVGWVWWEAK
ncbi:unnamed protein product [Dovyalis caffra]|uniref:Uncharacterized protein n=1 Tax=Dovyalis caffra TaxID=77055 RepID=A0AAV1RQE7_9ROSI|nr:unnamed protein product [Dovyalis caffra]